MKIGVFGGTFDPVHNGHLAIAETVRNDLGLDFVLFVPTGQPWLKANVRVSPAEHRVGMLRLAIGGKPYFRKDSVKVAISRGTSLDELGIESGDQVIVPRQRDGERMVRIFGFLLALPAAIYGITALTHHK